MATKSNPHTTVFTERDATNMKRPMNQVTAFGVVFLAEELPVRRHHSNHEIRGLLVCVEEILPGYVEIAERPYGDEHDTQEPGVADQRLLRREPLPHLGVSLLVFF